MDDSVLLLVLLDFVFIISLSKVFFRRDGSFNARWWSVSAPIGAVPVFLAASRLFDFSPWVPDGWLPVTELVAVLCMAGSIALIAMTMGTHRVPLALWQQANDEPQYLVTWGSYRLIRHPFYTGYLFAFLGALTYFPHPVTLMLFLYEAVMLNTVAAKEERKLCASEFGTEYQNYVSRTSRFLPLGTSKSTGSPRTSADQEVAS